MAQHKNAEMIKAKAFDMDLVVLGKYYHEDKWRESGFDKLIFADGDYFLCAPCNQEECLHWLNGGDVEYKDFDNDWSLFCDKRKWKRGNRFMSVTDYFRIKPKTEKRWIAVAKNGESTMHYESKEKLLSVLSDCQLTAFQPVEIEIEAQP